MEPESTRNGFREQIKAEFEKNNFKLDEEDEILEKCVTFCINYELSPADLVSSWDLYSLNRQLELEVRNAHMDGFQQQLQIERKGAIIKQEQGLHSYIDVSMELDDEHDEARDIIPSSPIERPSTNYLESFDSEHKTNGSIYSSGKPLDLVTPFGQRKTKFVVVSTLNGQPNAMDVKIENGEENNDDDIIKRVQPRTRCTLQSHCSQPEQGCRFMYDRIEDKFNSLENRILKHAKALVASGLIKEPMDPSVATQESVSAVGMICCEEEGRLKEKPIMLQSSVEHSGGQRVRLDLQKLSQFSIFPGQVVGVEGHNPSGHCLIATKIIDYLPLSVAGNEDPHPVKKYGGGQENQPIAPPQMLPDLSLIIASGPYTTTDNLFFEPLTELLAYARRKQPQLLLLFGPFIDSEHPDVKRGAINRTYDELFRLEILGKIQDYIEYMGSAVRVVLVPSIRDAHHHYVFPQPPFDTNAANLKEQITSLTNPGTFTANEVKVGCCSVDILKQLSVEEVSRNAVGASKHRLSTLANHLLSQQSFYPLYPPAEDTPVDFSLAPEALHIAVIPDILIVPSDLAHFVRVLTLDGRNDEQEQVKCICVNPGRLARGEGGGFFVELDYHGDPESTSASIIRI